MKLSVKPIEYEYTLQAPFGKAFLSIHNYVATENEYRRLFSEDEFATLKATLCKAGTRDNGYLMLNWKYIRADWQVTTSSFLKDYFKNVMIDVVLEDDLSLPVNNIWDESEEYKQHILEEEELGKTKYFSNQYKYSDEDLGLTDEYKQMVREEILEESLIQLM